MSKRMTQWAPWPDDLEAAVRELRYIDGWTFSLEEIPRDYGTDDAQRIDPIAGGLTFVILVPCFDTYHPEVYRPVTHYHPVPAATFNRAAWERWLLDRLLATTTHETCESFRFEREVSDQIGAHLTLPERTEVRRPFAPTHGPGDDPYVIHDFASELQRRTSFRGELNT